MAAQYRWQTVAETFEQICNNQPPWVAIGNFLNDWWFYAVAHRQEMVAEPLIPATSLEMQRWAAFCAAMVEWLCWQAELPFPAWTNQSCYILTEPWFYYEDPADRAWLLAATPAPFKTRNIFVGDRVFSNKSSAPSSPGSP